MFKVINVKTTNCVDSFTWGAWGRASRSLRWWWPCGPSQPARCPPLCTEPSSAWRRLWSGLGLVFSVATRGKGKKSCVTAYLYPHQPHRVTTCCPLIGWFPVNTLISLVRKYTSKDPFPNFFWSMKVCQNLLIYIILSTSTSATITWLQSHVTWEIKINGENRTDGVWMKPKPKVYFVLVWISHLNDMVTGGQKKEYTESAEKIN